SLVLFRLKARNLRSPLPNPDILNKIFSRLECIDSKLMRLDKIEKSVAEISSKVEKMDDKVVSLESKIESIERSRQFDSQTMTEINKNHSGMQKDLTDIKKAQTVLAESEARIKEQLIDLKCREMRDNLLFYNVPEERGETDDVCVEKLFNIMEEDMKIDYARRDIKLHRAHRIGRYINGKTRPIVAKFAYYPDRERVRKASSVLRDTESVYGVGQQYPKEVQERRRALVPIMKQARLNGRDAYIVVDKLYIDKTLYRGPVSPATPAPGPASGLFRRSAQRPVAGPVPGMVAGQVPPSGGAAASEAVAAHSGARLTEDDQSEATGSQQSMEAENTVP
ncbi:MAG: hypothetical protein N0E59_20955, partial [Candidatus Thiodiazotropha taylori]|nr:hypothetical protein [Candidatus Thiodiazotropha taylori]MCW4285589.1 hypothetical protein [Candidatus Thiodiazotropha taylori]